MANHSSTGSVYVQSEFNHNGKTKVASEMRPGDVFTISLSLGSAPAVTYTLFRLLGATETNRLHVKLVPRPALIRCCHIRGGKKGAVSCDVSSAWWILEVAKKTDRLEYFDVHGNRLLSVRIVEPVPRRTVIFNVAQEEDDSAPSAAAPGASSVRLNVAFAAVEVRRNTQPFLMHFDGVRSGWEFRRSLLNGHVPNDLARRVSRSVFRVDDIASDLGTGMTLVASSFRGRVYRKDGSDEPIDGRFRLELGDTAELVGLREVFGPNGEILGTEFPPVSRGQFLSVSVDEPWFGKNATGGRAASAKEDPDMMIDVDVCSDGEGDDDDGYDTQPEGADDRSFIDDGIGVSYTASYRIPVAEARMISEAISKAAACHGARTTKPGDIIQPTVDRGNPNADLPEELVNKIRGSMCRNPSVELGHIDSIVRTLRAPAFQQIMQDNDLLDGDEAEWNEWSRKVDESHRQMQQRKRARLEKEEANPDDPPR